MVKSWEMNEADWLTVSYADFVLVGYFQFAKRCGQDIFDRLMGLDSSFQPLYDACAQWLARDDH